MTLSLCMIVKNEEDVLARALSTAAVYADEIVIVDTGSSDGTVDTARRFTDKVYPFKWVNDFAAARNFAVEKSSGDYWMWLDADDIVTHDNARKISRIKSALDGVDVVMLPYVLETDGNGKPTFSYYRERIVRRGSGLKFKGRVHEAVELRGNIVRRAPIILHAKPTGRVAGTRNLDIYKGMIADGVPFSPRDMYYHARELFYTGDIAAAANRFREFISRPDGFAANKIDACVMLSRCYVKLGDATAALNVLFESFGFGLPTGETCCEIGLRFFARADYRTAAYWFERAASLKPDRNTGTFVDANCYGFLPFVWLTVCYDRLGDLKTAYKWHLRAKKIRPDHPSVYANDKYFALRASDRT